MWAGEYDLGADAWILAGDRASDVAGWRVDADGDVDGDQIADILVGAPLSDQGANDAGIVYVWTGGVTGDGDLRDAHAWIVGEFPDDGFGADVHFAGDQDGDGFSDIVAVHMGGEIWCDSSGNNQVGIIDLYSGAITGEVASTAALGRWSSEGRGDYAGCGLANLGDINGDELDDIAVSAWGSDVYETDAGAAYVIYGGGLAGEHDLGDADVRLYGSDQYFRAGSSLGDAGDLDGDGLTELAVGA